MATSSRGRPQKTREQVRVWLGTVVGPLRNALSVEAYVLGRGSYSYRGTLRDFEYLLPMDRVISAVYMPNLHQFWRYHPSLESQGEKHDDVLGELREACNEALDGLLKLESFQQLLRAGATVLRAAATETIVGGYVVDGRRELPSHFADEGWREGAEQFLALRQDPALTATFHKIEKLGGSLRKVVETLHRDLESAQRDLADRYGLAPVDPADAATA